jgi:hypothetical protein
LFIGYSVVKNQVAAPQPVRIARGAPDPPGARRHAWKISAGFFTGLTSRLRLLVSKTLFQKI